MCMTHTVGKENNHHHIYSSVSLLSPFLLLTPPGSAVMHAELWQLFKLLIISSTTVECFYAWVIDSQGRESHFSKQEGNLYCLPVYLKLNNSWLGLLSAQVSECINCTLCWMPRLCHMKMTKMFFGHFHRTAMLNNVQGLLHFQLL